MSIFQNCEMNTETECDMEFHVTDLLLKYNDSLILGNKDEIIVVNNSDSSFLLQSLIYIGDSAYNVFLCDPTVDSVWFSYTQVFSNGGFRKLDGNFYLTSKNRYLKDSYPESYSFIIDSVTDNALDILRISFVEFNKILQDERYNEIVDLVISFALYKNRTDSKQTKNTLVDLYIFAKLEYLSCLMVNSCPYMNDRRIGIELLSKVLNEKFDIQTDTIEPYHHTYADSLKLKRFEELKNL